MNLPSYNPDPYRAFEHDPVLVRLDLTEDAAPACGRSWRAYEVRVSKSVVLDASGSVDPAGKGLTYAWDFDGDGEFDDAQGPMPTFYARGTGPGQVMVAVQVTDANGQTAVDTATIDVVTPGRGNGGRPPGKF